MFNDASFLGLIVVSFPLVAYVVIRFRRLRARTKKPHQRTDEAATPFGAKSAKVLRVLDGDTVDVTIDRTKVRIRLDSIDCPEDGQPWGDIAKFGLIKLIGGKSVFVEEHTVDCYDRTVATLYVQANDGNKWLNVNERMVQLGHAWVMRRFYLHLPRQRQYALNRMENWAKGKNVGLWGTPNPIPPWKWRTGGQLPPKLNR